MVSGVVSDPPEAIAQRITGVGWRVERRAGTRQVVPCSYRGPTAGSRRIVIAGGVALRIGGGFRLEDLVTIVSDGWIARWRTAAGDCVGAR